MLRDGTKKDVTIMSNSGGHDVSGKSHNYSIPAARNTVPRPRSDGAVSPINYCGDATIYSGDKVSSHTISSHKKCLRKCNDEKNCVYWDWKASNLLCTLRKTAGTPSIVDETAAGGRTHCTW